MHTTWYTRQRTALARLLSLIQNRAEAEQQVAAAYQNATNEAEQEVTKARKQTQAAHKKAMGELDEAYQQEAAEYGARYGERQSATERTRTERTRIAFARFDAEDEKYQTAYKERLWTIDSLVEAAEKESRDQFQTLARQAEQGRKSIAAGWVGVQPFLERVGLTAEEVEYPIERLPSATQTDPEGKLQKCLEDCETARERLEGAFFPKFLGIVPLMFLTFVCGAAGAGIGFVSGPPYYAVVGGVAGLIVGGLLAWFVILAIARRQIRDRGRAFGVYQAEGRRAADTLEDTAKATLSRQLADLKRRHANDTKRTQDHYLPLLANALKRRETEISQTEADYLDRYDSMTNERAIELRAAESRYEANAATILARTDEQTRAVESRYSARYEAAHAVRDRDFAQLSSLWFTGLSEVNAELTALSAAGQQPFPEWSELAAGQTALPTVVPFGIRFGQFAVDQFAIPEGEPIDARLTPRDPVRLSVPAYLPFPESASILLKAADEGRTLAVQTMQAMMLRFLTGLPPGKVRFTIIDPVGLGENFASFMTLADFDEQLVGARIWTEPTQIEKKLVDLTEHMENVIQKYLRNQYKSIEEYNQAAGEVAEPYRVLVIANFPTNFSPDAARRLISIMGSGPACGVCTLVSVDTKAALPRDFRLTDLEQVAFRLQLKDGKFAPTEPSLVPFPLTIDSPPPATQIAQIVRRIGQASQSAARVEVPFDFIRPAADAVWAGSTAKGFDIPVGRAGATKRQMFMLGRGTAQHALVAGKTGSGKSTLLHAIITNLSLIYSPDEAELYLIDFKKGVEFRAYATSELPHAKVVAIESEREFGLSVLQRLDAELRDRGDRFRAVGANDLASYREATGTICPRILLIVDEFQEFFVEDDKPAQEAALLLDRLVRQGRAFGLHLLLGSQTLGGAYSLARSTIDQMAVRIALQCSEADAQLILSKDNSAARLLSRPGEAIYNDANGMVEGNDPFQVVWLEDHQREEILTGLREKAAGKYPRPLVFEGNVSAELPRNLLLQAALQTPHERKSIQTWFGDAVAIKDPTAATLRPQAGANVLLIGQQEDAALALMATSLTSIVAQVSRPTDGPPLVTVFDGTPDDADNADTLRKVCGALGVLDAMTERSQLPTALANLMEELARRQSGEQPETAPRFLLIHGLQRFRELRKADDDYGFGRKTDGPKPPGELFTTLLREGPALGIHIIVWCDTYTNLTRGLDRQSLRDFHQRVLFQMSANDSSTLIDSPAASKLGRTRALFVQEDLERPEKFRPYGLPELSWLKTVGETIAARKPD